MSGELHGRRLVLVTVGIIAFEILAYIVFVRVLPVLPADQTAPAAAAAK